MSGRNRIFRKDVIGWSLYDFANTIYSMNIVSIYLKRYIVEDLHKSNAWFDVSISISMALSAIFLPALGAMSDHATKKKLFLFLFTLTCCVAVGSMALVPTGALSVLVLLFIVANFSYEAGQPFYNSLLYSVAEGKQARFISGLGVAVGYIGSSLGVMLVLPFVTGSLYGLEVPFISGWGKTGSFVPTAILFMIFALPLFLWVREKPVKDKRRVSMRQSYREVWEGLKATKRYPGVLRFLIADFFFEDAAMTVILNMGLYCAVVLEMDDSMITTFLAVAATTAVFGSLIIGKIAQHTSLKHNVRLIVIGWIICLVLFISTSNMTMLWILASVVGILLGGLWTTTRPMLAELVPEEELGKFFGIFALSGRAAAVVGPLLWTVTIILFDQDGRLGVLFAEKWNLSPSAIVALPYKMGISSLAIMMIVGLWIFQRVPHTSRSSGGN